MASLGKSSTQRPARNACTLLVQPLGQSTIQSTKVEWHLKAFPWGSYLDGPWEKRDSWLVTGDLLPLYPN